MSNSSFGYHYPHETRARSRRKKSITITLKWFLSRYQMWSFSLVLSVSVLVLRTAVDCCALLCTAVHCCAMLRTAPHCSQTQLQIKVVSKRWVDARACTRILGQCNPEYVYRRARHCSSLRCLKLNQHFPSSAYLGYLVGMEEKHCLNRCYSSSVMPAGFSLVA